MFTIFPCSLPLLTLLLFVPPAAAEVVTDGSLGAMRTLNGTFIIPQDLGTLRGQNLFHSFQTFNIEANEHATFTGAATIRNVISRVTGGSESRIDGGLTSQIGMADFYLINPAGVVIGKNARIDVPAALHVSTADELRFTDGGIASAREPKTSSLSVAAPAAYGFLGDQSGQIRLELTHLTGTPNSALTFVGRDIQISGSSLQIESGNLRMEAVGKGPHSVPVADASTTPAQGTLTVNGGSRLDTSGTVGGALNLRAGEINISGASVIRADHSGSTDASAQGIDIRADNGNVRVDNSEIRTSAWGNGNGGAVTVNAHGHVALVNAAQLRTETLATGAAGNVTVKASGDVTLQQAGAVSSRTFNTGKGGNVIVSAGGKLIIDGQTQTTSSKAAVSGSPTTTFTGVATQSGACCSNQAGNVNVVAGQGIFVQGQGTINSQGSGNSNTGAVTVTAPLILVNNGEIATASVTGTAGAVKIDTPRLLIKDAQIQQTNENGGIVLNSAAVNLNVNSSMPPINNGPPPVEQLPEKHEQEDAKKALTISNLHRKHLWGQTQENCRQTSGNSLIRSGSGALRQKAADLKPIVAP